MIAILEHGMLASKDMWPGHPSILPRVFGPSQYLMMPLAQLTKLKPKLKPMVTLKPLPADTTSKLTPPETQSDAKEWQHMQAIAGGDVRRVVAWNQCTKLLIWVALVPTTLCTGSKQFWPI